MMPVEGKSVIYKREEFIEQNLQDRDFPLKQIEQLIPLDGGAKKFVGHVSLGVQTPVGVTSIPVSFEIDAATIEEAFRKFPAGARAELEAAKAELQEQVQEARRKSQSRIITPGEIPPTDLGKLKL